MTIDDSDGGPVLSQLHGEGPANARPGTGYHGVAALEFAHERQSSKPCEGTEAFTWLLLSHPLQRSLPRHPSMSLAQMIPDINASSKPAPG